MSKKEEIMRLQREINNLRDIIFLKNRTLLKVEKMLEENNYGRPDIQNRRVREFIRTVV